MGMASGLHYVITAVLFRFLFKGITHFSSPVEMRYKHLSLVFMFKMRQHIYIYIPERCVGNQGAA